PESHPNPVPKRTPDPNVAPLPSGNPPKHVQQPAKPARPKSGVLSSSGVLAATGAVGHGSLPFTGFPLWAVVILAAALIADGIAVSDRSEVHSFHLKGPGVDMRTPIDAKQEITWTVTFTEGRYVFFCDAHESVMRGYFLVGNVPPSTVSGSVGPGRKITLR